MTRNALLYRGIRSVVGRRDQREVWLIDAEIEIGIVLRGRACAGGRRVRRGAGLRSRDGAIADRRRR